MIGIDIIEIERIKHAIERTSFLEKVFTEGEREYCSTRGREESLAGIFAAKESIAKALGTGIRGFAINEIEVKHDAAGRPYAVFHGRAKNLVGNRSIDISISHCGMFAIAIACIAGGVKGRSSLGQELLDAKLDGILTSELDTRLEETLAGDSWQLSSEKKSVNKRVQLFNTSDSVVPQTKLDNGFDLSKSSDIDKIYEKAMGKK